MKVARAPSRELVALLEGTDEALDGLEGLGEVVIDTIACSQPAELQGDLCESQRCPSNGNPRPRRGAQPAAGHNNNRW